LRLAPKAPKADYALLRRCIWLYVCVMTAAEIIEQIKALPPEEQAQVLDFIGKMRNESFAPTKQIRYASADEVAAAGEKVLEQYKDVFRRLSQ